MQSWLVQYMLRNKQTGRVGNFRKVVLAYTQQEALKRMLRQYPAYEPVSNGNASRY